MPDRHAPLSLAVAAVVACSFFYSFDLFTLVFGFWILFWHHGPLFLFRRFWFLFYNDSQHSTGPKSGLSLFFLSAISEMFADCFYFADRVCDPGPGSGLFLSDSFFCSLISLNRSNALEPDRTALLRFEQKHGTKKQTEQTEQANTKKYYTLLQWPPTSWHCIATL